MTLGLDFSFRLELLYDEAHVDYLQIVFYIYTLCPLRFKRSIIYFSILTIVISTGLSCKAG
jgi:hypothetical protein